MQNDPPCILIRFHASPSGVRRTLHRVRVEMLAYGATASLLGRTETVLGEVLNNIVEHALPKADCDTVQISGKKVGGGWYFDIFDKGHPLPHGRPPGSDFPDLETPLEDLPEGGFGWALVQALTRDLAYQRRSGGNCLSFLVPYD